MRAIFWLTLIFPVIFFSSCSDSDNILDNGKLKASFRIADGFLIQEYYARDGSNWKLIARSASTETKKVSALYDTAINNGGRYLLSHLKVKSIESRSTKNENSVVVTGTINETAVTLTVNLHDTATSFHVAVRNVFDDQNATVEYVLSDLQFEANTNAPEFVHTPALKFEAQDIIGDRTFWSPALVMQENNLFVSIVPDLQLINQHKRTISGARPVGTGRNFGIPVDSSNITFPTGFDIARSQQESTSPVLFAYGFIDAVAKHHMHWFHPNDSSMLRRIGRDTLTYGFNLFVSAEKEPFFGYQEPAQFIWKKYGNEEFNKRKTLPMPFSEYASICYPASMAYKGSELANENDSLFARHYREKKPSYSSFLEFEIDGKPVGGYRNNAPQWYDMIGNTTWWNNVRDAVGMYEWGKRLGDSSLKQKAEKVINLAMTAPVKDGAFATVYEFEPRKWVLSHWGPPMQMDSTESERYFDSPSKSYHTPGMSKTAVHLLRYYKHAVRRQDILAFAQQYANFLHSHVDTSGCVPSFFNADLKPSPYLRVNGEGGVHIWFLTTLYGLTGEERHLELAKRIAADLQKRVIPLQDWKDFEVYFSCGVKPMNFYDRFTNQPARNTLSTYWAVEGLTGLYAATKEKVYLDNALRAADYLSFYQASWQPHFITTAYAFGGFGVQNTDAEWLDARQGEIAPAFVRLGKIAGRNDLIERGIAAAKASLILVNTDAHKNSQLYTYTNFPAALGPENIDHEGFPQSPMRTNAGWGEVSGLSGVADILLQGVEMK